VHSITFCKTILPDDLPRSNTKWHLRGLRQKQIWLPEWDWIT